MTIQLPKFGVESANRSDPGNSKRLSGWSADERPPYQWFNQLAYETFENLRAADRYDHVIGTNAQVDDNDASCYYDSATQTFKDISDNTVTISNGERLLIIGLDTLSDDLDLSARDFLHVVGLPSYEIGNGTHDLKFGKNSYVNVKVNTTANITADLNTIILANGAAHAMDFNIMGNEYERDQNWQKKEGDNNKIQSPNKCAFVVNGKTFKISSMTDYDLDVEANWDDAETTYATPGNRNGMDFYVYACDDLSGAVDIVLSALNTWPADYSELTSRKIGGFHCLCEDVGAITLPTLGGVDHDLDSYVTGDILPLSVWDLDHRPKNHLPEGMIYDDKLCLWVDIYLNSLSGGVVESKCGEIAHSGGIGTNDFHWYNWAEFLGAIGKRLPFQHEFIVFSLGSNQETEISTEAATNTGGNSDHPAGRRMIANNGCEDCCGLLQQWGADTGPNVVYANWKDAHTIVGGDYGNADSYDEAEDTERGEQHTCPTRPLFGGTWNGAASCGSRYSGWISSPLALSSSLGARGVCEPQ